MIIAATLVVCVAATLTFVIASSSTRPNLASLAVAPQPVAVPAAPVPSDLPRHTAQPVVSLAGVPQPLPVPEAPGARQSAAAQVSTAVSLAHGFSVTNSPLLAIVAALLSGLLLAAVRRARPALRPAAL
jgi:hypothetical protein